MGLYFAQISSEGVCEAVESADAYIFIGPTFNDYSTCAFSHLLSESKMVRVDARRVTVAGKQTFGCVNMAEFLPQLAKELEPNDTTWQAFKRTYVGPGKVPSNGPDEPLKGKILYSHLQVGCCLPVACTHLTQAYVKLWYTTSLSVLTSGGCHTCSSWTCSELR